MTGVEVRVATIIDQHIRALGLRCHSDMLAQELCASGLLVTPLHERALEACKVASDTKAGGNITAPGALRRWYECCAVGREALEADNDRLEDELSAAKARITALEGEWEKEAKHAQWLSGELAAAQAREHVLLDTLAKLHVPLPPQDDSALRALMVEAVDAGQDEAYSAIMACDSGVPRMGVSSEAIVARVLGEGR